MNHLKSEFAIYLMDSYAHFEDSYRDVRDFFDFENKPAITLIEKKIPAKSHEGYNNVLNIK